MTESFRDELATWMSQNRHVQGLGRKEYQAAFLAVRGDVIAAVAAGFALKTIWEHMRETGRIPFRYETFLKHVRRHITNAPAVILSSPQKKPGKRSSEMANAIKADGREKRTPPSVGGFSFNSNTKPEDLC